MVNFTNLLSGISDRDNSIKREARGIITICQMMNIKIKSIFNKKLPRWKVTT